MRPAHIVTTKSCVKGGALRRSTISCGALSVALAAALLSACSSGSSPSVEAEQLVGTWVGTNAGYEGGDTFVSQDVQVVITEVSGNAFVGAKEWTDAQGVTGTDVVKGVVGPDGRVIIVDSDGIIEGTVSGSELIGVYTEVGEESTAFSVTMTKQ